MPVQDNRQQGGWRLAYTDVFTACPEPAYRTTGSKTRWQVAQTGSGSPNVYSDGLTEIKHQNQQRNSDPMVRFALPLATAFH